METKSSVYIEILKKYKNDKKIIKTKMNKKYNTLGKTFIRIEDTRTPCEIHIDKILDNAINEIKEEGER